jgi:hypothetical protein
MAHIAFVPGTCHELQPFLWEKNHILLYHLLVQLDLEKKKGLGPKCFFWQFCVIAKVMMIHMKI